MAKGITKRAKQEVANSFAEALEDLCRTERGWLPERLYVEMRVRWRSSRGGLMEKDAPLLKLVVPPPILYNTPGELTGEIKGYNISVFQYGQGRFKTWINGREQTWLSRTFVVENLGIPVRIKRSGPQAGQHSETNSKAVWRHLADRYNNGDMTVFYEPPAYRVVRA